MVEHLKPHQFKPGQSGNPKGFDGIPKEVRKAKGKNRIELEKTLNEFLTLDRDGLELRLKNPKATILELALGAIVTRAIDDGDQVRLNFMLDRLIGKVKEQISIEIPAPTVIKRFGSEETVVLGVDVKALPEGSED